MMAAASFCRHRHGNSAAMFAMLLLCTTVTCFVAATEAVCPRLSDATISGCTCSQTNDTSLVVCNGTDNQHIPSGLPNAQLLMFLNNSELKIVDEVAYRFAQSVRFEGNGIWRINENAFRNASILKNILIFNESLRGQDISPEVFRSYTVNYIEINNTELVTLKSGVFASSVLPELQEIKLTHCSLMGMESNVFRNATKLQYLSASFNKLHSIPNFSDTPLLHLSVLDLSYNEITSLAGLRHVPRLVNLLLSHNRLTHIATTAFESISENVSFIDLSHNNIAVIDPTAFSRMLVLNELTLDNNQLERVFWEELPVRIAKMSLFENRWCCNCSNAYLVEGHNNVDVYNKGTLTCASPKQVRGMAVKSVPGSYFLCDVTQENGDGSKKKAVVVVLTVFVLIVITALAVAVFYKVRARRRRYHQSYAQFSSPDEILSYTDDEDRLSDTQPRRW